MRKKSVLLTFFLLFFGLLEISSVYAGTYQSTCPAKKFAKIEAEIRKNFKPRKNLNGNGPPVTVEKKIKKPLRNAESQFK